ncbi:MAG: O-antigen ligase family protein [Caldimonas sp.]
MLVPGGSDSQVGPLWSRAFDAAPDGRWRMRAVWLVGMTLLAALAMLLGGGRPVLLGLLGLLALAWVLHDPLIAVGPLVMFQIIWVFGAYAPGGVAALSPSKLSLALAGLGWIVWAWRERVAPTYAPHQWGFGLFFATVLAGPFVSPAFDDAVVGIGKFGLMFLTYLLVANLAVNRRGVTTVAAAITVTACVAALLALFERLLPGVELDFEGAISLGAHTDDESLTGLAIKRVSGGLGDANWFSYTMATTLPLCLYWFRAYTSGWVRSAAVCAAMLQFGGIVLSYTRTPLVGLAGALLFLVWQKRIALLPVVLGAVVALVSAPAWLPAGFLDRFFSQEYIKEGSTPVRAEIFEMAVDLIRDRPILGYGFDQFGPQFIERSTSDMGWEWARRDRTGEEPAKRLRAHNLYLDVWVQGGIVALAGLVIGFGWLLRELWIVSRAARDREADLALCLFAGLLSFYLCGMGGHSQELKIFWVTAGLVAGLRRWVLSGYREPEHSARTA